MGLESSFNFIDDLDDTNPAAGDDVSQGDNHLRGIKEAVQGSFPSLGSAAVTATAAELNIMDGLTAFLDEDDMASDSATAIASQQSIKAFVNTKLGSLNQKIVDIGDWDMDTDASVSVAHGLTMSKIRSVSAMIIPDSGAVMTDFSAIDMAGTQTNYIQAQSANIFLRRATGGFFDTSSYSTTPFDRGYIVIQYID